MACTEKNLVRSRIVLLEEAFNVSFQPRLCTVQGLQYAQRRCEQFLPLQNTLVPCSKSQSSNDGHAAEDQRCQRTQRCNPEQDARNKASPCKMRQRNEAHPRFFDVADFTTTGLPTSTGRRRG